MSSPQSRTIRSTESTPKVRAARASELAERRLDAIRAQASINLLRH